MRRLLIAMAIGMLVMTSAALAAERTEGPRRGERMRGRSVQLTPEQKALLEQAKDLRKQIRIARLELLLAEAKDAPEGEIAARAEHLYALLGRQHAFQVKHRALFRELRGRMGRRWRHGRGEAVAPGRRGAGRGIGRGAGMGRHGMRGRGRGRGAGAGAGMGWMQGQGLREQGRGRGMGGGMGRGRGAGMQRGWRGPIYDETAPAPGPPPAEEFVE